jgi:Ni,Fe-hydrogenase I large subunit
MMLLASSMAMAQLSPGAEGIRQKLAEYARQQGMKTNYEGDALTIQRDTIEYVVLFGGSNPVYVEIRLTDFGISNCIPACINKAANYININKGVTKVSISPDGQNIRFSAESFVNDAQSVIAMLKRHLDNLIGSYYACCEKYDEFVVNQQFANLRIPFEVYSAQVANVDKDNNILTELGTDIKSADTQYINTSISIILYDEGDYDIGVKFIPPDGNTSKAGDDGSPYSFTTTLQMTHQQTDYLIGGWGSTTPGTWGPGNYRIELYYKDKPFYIKPFVIK